MEDRHRNRDARLRQLAEKRGLSLMSRGGHYMIVDAKTRFALAGADPIPYSLTQDEVEQWLRETPVEE